MIEIIFCPLMPPKWALDERLKFASKRTLAYVCFWGRSGH